MKEYTLADATMKVTQDCHCNRDYADEWVSEMDLDSSWRPSASCQGTSGENDQPYLFISLYGESRGHT